MAIFKPGEPIDTDTATIEVTANADLPLRPGRHQFQLVVEDDAGNRSDPDIVEVVVRDTIKPTAVLEAPKLLQPGQTFNLDGRRSSDVAPGQLVKFEWTLLS